jgi:hypothetical protein
MSHKLKEDIEDIFSTFRLSPGINSGDDVEFAAVDNKSDMSEKMFKIEGFRYVHLYEDAFDFVEFREVSGESSFDKYSFCFFDEEKLRALIGRLGKFSTEMGDCVTLDSFCSVWNAVKEKHASESIQRYYSDTWEYLRYAIRLVCIQFTEFFELCIKEKKSVWMLGI